jgi:hypothetical protein
MDCVIRLFFLEAKRDTQRIHPVLRSRKVRDEHIQPSLLTVTAAPTQNSTFRSTVIRASNAEAEKVPLPITLYPSAENLPDEKKEVVLRAKETIEKESFTWGTFPVSLPTSTLEECFSQIRVR